MQFFTTKPLPCDPSSLPEYPPSKEYDAKLREEEARRYSTLFRIYDSAVHFLVELHCSFLCVCSESELQEEEDHAQLDREMESIGLGHLLQALLLETWGLEWPMFREEEEEEQSLLLMLMQRIPQPLPERYCMHGNSFFTF